MKFAVEAIGKLGSRIGHLETTSCENITTPMCLLYTRAGSVPHLTYDVLQKVTALKLPTHLTLSSLVDTVDSVRGFQKGIGNFVGLKDHLIYVSVQDPASTVPPGYNNKIGVALWNRKQRHQVSIEKFLEVQECFQPDWVQCLCDSDTDENSSVKRIQKAVDRTLVYLDECLRKQSQFKWLKKAAVFASIEGGFCLQERIRSAKLTAQRPVAGFVLEGFRSNGPEVEKFNFDEIKEILLEVLRVLPDDKPRVMHGVYRPDVVLTLVEHGIDIFDTSYPFLVTERGGALAFSFDYKAVNRDQLLAEDHTVNEATKLPKFEINMKDKEYFDDFSPLMAGCSCYTCRCHSRAYVNHLLVTSEMLATVLLMIHNLHHYLQFFQSIRNALAADKFQELKAAVSIGR